MIPMRSPRAWAPALAAAVTLLVVLLGGAALDPAVGGDDALLIYLIGTAATALGTSLEPLVVLVLAVLAFAGTFVVHRGLRPGSSGLTAFAATWLVTIVTTAVGAITHLVVVNGVHSGSGEYAAIIYGTTAGLAYGLVAAAVTSVVWGLVRSRSAEEESEPLSVTEGNSFADDFASRFDAAAARGRFAADVEPEYVPLSRPDVDPVWDRVPVPERPTGQRTGPDPLPDAVRAMAGEYRGRRSTGRYADEQPEVGEDVDSGSHRA